MSYFYIVPEGFLKFSIAMQILFALVSFLVAYFSFKIYNLSRQREIKLFGISFLLISCSYILWAIIHLSIVSDSLIKLVKLTTPNLARLGLIAVSLHVTLFIIGLLTLAYINLKIKRGKVFYLITGLSMITLIAPLIIVKTIYEPVEFQSLMTILIGSRILSIFLLTFIIFNYFEEYIKNKNKKTLMVWIAFSLLLLSNTDFILSLAYYQAYIMGNILEFMAYVFILISLILTIRK